MPKNKVIKRTSVHGKRPQQDCGARETAIKDMNVAETDEKIKKLVRRIQNRTRVASTLQTGEEYLAGT
jgi:hypothetical protein